MARASLIVVGDFGDFGFFCALRTRKRILTVRKGVGIGGCADYETFAVTGPALFICGKLHQTQKNRQRGCAKISDAPWPAGKLSGVAVLPPRAGRAMGVPFNSAV